MRDIIVVPTSHDECPNLMSWRWLSNRGVRVHGKLEDVRVGPAVRGGLYISLHYHSLRAYRDSCKCRFTIDGSLSMHAGPHEGLWSSLVRKDSISASRMENPTAAADCRGDGQARHGNA